YRVVALFPAASVGRFPLNDRGEPQKPLPARLRLDAYPWTRHGMLEAKVTRVGNESADGFIRVELEVTNSHGIPLEHGLTATVEGAVDGLSPGQLLLRAAGQALRAQR